MVVRPCITGPLLCWVGVVHELHGQLELCYGLDVVHVGPAPLWQVGGEEETREPGDVLYETFAHLWGHDVMSRAQFGGGKTSGSGLWFCCTRC